MEKGIYRISIDGKWDLADLSSFHTYNQVYSLLYSLHAPIPSDTSDGAITKVQDEEQLERLQYTFTAFPWNGGWSAVDFYENLYRLIPREDRPHVKSIRYSSPGVLELTLVLLIAQNAKTLISNIAHSIREMNKTYQAIYKGLQDRKLLRIKVKREKLKLAAEELRFVEESNKRLARLMEFQHLQALIELSGSPFIALKILLSLYRRVRDLADYEIKEKLKF
jgi:hypothetical protein